MPAPRRGLTLRLTAGTIDRGGTNKMVGESGQRRVRRPLFEF